MYAKEFPCSWFLEDRIHIYKEKEKLVVAYLRPPQNMKLGNVQWRERNVQKSVMHVQSCFAYSKYVYIIFWTSLYLVIYREFFAFL